jgi:hypothetical protein
MVLKPAKSRQKHGEAGRGVGSDAAACATLSPPSPVGQGANRFRQDPKS